MTTGKVEVPPLVVPMTPTVDTVPKMGCVASVGVIVVWSPFFSLARSEAPTVALTSHALVAMTTIWAEDADDAALLPAAAVPAPAAAPAPVEAPALELPDVELPPATVSPTLTLTAATVPAMVEVSVDWSSACWAEVTLVWADVTCALAEAICWAFAAVVAAVS